MVGILGENVYTVHLGIIAVFVAFAFQDFVDGDVGVEQGGYKSLQHVEVSFVAQQSLECPVETDVCTFLSHEISILNAKIRNIFGTTKCFGKKNPHSHEGCGD